MTNKAERLRFCALKGRQGDWLVEVEWEDGSTEQVPVAHTKFYDGASHIYRREDSTLERFKRFKGKVAKWRDRLYRSSKVVLTDDIWEGDAPPKRNGYVGVFDISELEFEGEAGHSFKIVNRYQKTAVS